jgi:hypothetical protein
MTAGPITRTIGDGNSGTFTGGFWSLNGVAGGTNVPQPMLLGNDGLTAFSASNPLYFQSITAGAVVSAANPLFAGLSTAGAAVSVSNPIYFQPVNGSGTAIDLSAGTAGTPGGGVSSVQGVSGMTALSVTQTTVAFDVATTITRPANTTAYTANDVLGGALDLGVLGPSGAAVMITSLQLEADIAAVPSGQTSWIVHLYNVTPPSAIADNGAFDIASGDRASYLGQIPLAALVDQGSTLYVESNIINKQVKLSGTHLFAYLVTVGGFTPNANSEVYKLTVHTVAV